METSELPDRSAASVRAAWTKSLRKYVPYYLVNYGLFPALAGPFFWKVLLGNWLAETARDVYSAATIWCGHVGEDVKSWPAGTKARSRGELVDRMVEPLLLWPQDPEAPDFAFLPEPIVNTRAVRGAGPSDDILGEVGLLAGELGLDARDSLPLDELVARLRDIRPEWQWKEPLVPAPLRPVGGRLHRLRRRRAGHDRLQAAVRLHRDGEKSSGGRDWRGRRGHGGEDENVSRAPVTQLAAGGTGRKRLRPLSGGLRSL